MASELENLLHLLHEKSTDTTKQKVAEVVELVNGARMAQKVYNVARTETRLKWNASLISTIRRTALTEDRDDAYYDYTEAFLKYEKARDAAFFTRHKAERALHDFVINVLSEIENTSDYYANHYGEKDYKKTVEAAGKLSRKKLMQAVDMLQRLLD